jgi:hypothetical protein
LTDAVLTTYEAMETVRNICNKVCPRESNEWSGQQNPRSREYPGTIEDKTASKR